MNEINVTVGQEVAVAGRYADRDYSFGWVVRKVTEKKGEIVVGRADWDNYTIRFDKRGWEVGSGNSYHRARLEPNVVEAREQTARKARSIEAVNAITDVHANNRVSWGWSKESLVEEVARLEQLLAEARAKVEAI